jgi:TPR repeat protein
MVDDNKEKLSARSLLSLRQEAYRYWTGLGVEADPAKALDLFEQCDPNDPIVAYHLGVGFREGHFFEYNPEKAQSYFDKARPGLEALSPGPEGPLALYCLGAMAYNGYGQEIDFSAAFSYFSRSASSGFYRAAATYIEAADDHPEFADGSTYLSLLMRLVHLNDPTGHYAYLAGRAYFEGKGTAPDIETANILFSIALDKGDSSVDSYLDYHPEAVSSLDEKAAPSLAKAEAESDPMAYVEAGLIYQDNGVEEEDFKRAESCFLKAQKLSYSYGSFYLGVLYADHNNFFPAQTPETIIALLKEGEKRHYRHSSFFLAVAYCQDQNNPESRAMMKSYLLKAAAEDDPKALTALTKLCYNAGQVDFFDPENALHYGHRYLEIAKETDENYQETMLWVALIDYTKADPVSLKEAFELFQKGAEAGVPRSMCYLGICYRDGLEGVAPDNVKAVATLRQAMAAGSSEAVPVLKALLVLHPECQVEGDAAFIAKQTSEEETDAMLQKFSEENDEADATVQLSEFFQFLLNYPDYALGNALLSGSSGKSDVEAGLAAMDRAAHMGHPLAFNALINHYQNEPATPENLAKLQEYTLLGADLLPANFLLEGAKRAFMGCPGVPQNLDQAASLVRRATASQKITPLVYEDPNAEQANENVRRLQASPYLIFNHCQTGANNGDLRSAFLLAKMRLGQFRSSDLTTEYHEDLPQLQEAFQGYLQGLLDPKISPDKKAKEQKKLQRVYRGLITLGHQVKSQLDFVAQSTFHLEDYQPFIDPSAGEKILRDLADKDYGPAILLLADIAMEKAEYQTAVALFTRALELGYSEAATYLEEARCRQVGIEPSKRCDIFISWNHLDKTIKDDLVAHLRERGLSVWDSDSYCNGEIPLACQMAIERSSLFLVLVTSNALQSGYIPQEILWMKDRASRSALGQQTIKGLFINVEDDLKTLSQDPAASNNPFVWLYSDHVGSSFHVKAASDINLDDLVSQLRLGLESSEILHYRDNLGRDCQDFNFSLADRTLSQIQRNDQLIKTRIIMDDGYVNQPLYQSDETAFSGDPLALAAPLLITGAHGSGKSLYLRSLIHKGERLDRLFFSLDHSQLISVKDEAGLLEVLRSKIESESGLGHGLSFESFTSLFSKKGEKGFGEIYLLIDGLDQLPSESLIPLSHTLRAFHLHYPKVHLIFTATDPAYFSSVVQPIDSDGQILHLKPFEKKNRLELVHRIFANAGSGTESKEKENVFLRSVENLSDDVGGNPLLVSNLAVVYLTSGKVPTTRYAITEQAAAIFLGDLSKEQTILGGSLSEYTRKSLGEIIAFLSFCKTGGPDRSNEEIVEQFYKEHLNRETMAKDYDALAQDHFRKLEASALVEILVSRGILSASGLYHQTFADFFAARWCYSNIYETASTPSGLQCVKFQESGLENLTDFANVCFVKEGPWSWIVSQLVLGLDHSIYLVSFGYEQPSTKSMTTLEASLEAIYSHGTKPNRPSYQILSDFVNHHQVHYWQNLSSFFASTGSIS